MFTKINRQNIHKLHLFMLYKIQQNTFATAVNDSCK